MKNQSAKPGLPPADRGLEEERAELAGLDAKFCYDGHRFASPRISDSICKEGR
jgi:hypothetical protein